MSESIERPGWRIKFMDNGSLEIWALETHDNHVPILDVRPVNHRHLFIIRRRIASGAGDIPRRKATEAGGKI
jgi:hypothetical protein